MNERKPVILILEDEPYLLWQLKNMFEEEKFEVLDCVNIYEAKKAWNENKHHIDVISTDTNMSCNGLTDEESELTGNGRYSGWFWLKYYVLNDDECPFPIERVFLLSEYIQDLRKYISDNKKYGYDELNILKNKKHLINRGDPRGATELLIDTVKKELPKK